MATVLNNLDLFEGKLETALNVNVVTASRDDYHLMRRDATKLS